MKAKPVFYFTNQTCDRKLAREIELRIEKLTGLELRNPFYDDEAKEVKSLDATGQTNLSPDEIVGMDLRKIRECGALLALMTNDKDVGSCMEIAIAAEHWGFPVYVIALTPQHYSHPWIKFYASQLFASPYEFIKFAHGEWGKPEDAELNDETVKQLKYGFKPKTEKTKDLKERLINWLQPQKKL